MPSPYASILNLVLLSVVFGPGCTSSSDGGGNTMAQTMFHPSCQEPQASTAVTCDNVCDKVALCTAGLCAQQTATAELCGGSVAAELKASCLSTCDEGSLKDQAEDVACLLENTCASVFLQQTCGPENSVECGGLSTPTPATTGQETTGQGDTGQPPPCPFEFDDECDEPEGTGLCAEGTDPADCSGSGTFGSTTDGWGSSGTWGSSSGSTGWTGSSGSTGGSSTSF